MDSFTWIEALRVYKQIAIGHHDFTHYFPEAMQEINDDLNLTVWEGACTQLPVSVWGTCRRVSSPHVNYTIHIRNRQGSDDITWRSVGEERPVISLHLALDKEHKCRAWMTDFSIERMTEAWANKITNKCWLLKYLVENNGCDTNIN